MSSLRQQVGFVIDETPASGGTFNLYIVKVEGWP
jgi:hypothetical protein